MDMLKAILDIEKKAQKIASTFDLSALEEKQKTEKILEELEEEENLKVNEELSIIKIKNEKELKAELDKNFTLMTERLKAMEKFFEDNEKRWINEITQKITGGNNYGC